MDSQQTDQEMQVQDGRNNEDVPQVADEGYSQTAPNPDGFFADTNNQAACSVRVALRIRPLIHKEKHEGQIVQAFPENHTVTIGGSEKTFTYDACFGQNSKQEEVFERCVKNLVLGCFSGFNATVLAYGQTGSGKTWTMGSGYTFGLSEEDHGIIPRVIKTIFDEVEKRKSRVEFIIKCSFLEIYNEELNDLLDGNALNMAGEKNNKINIREEKNGSISVYGLREEKVENAEELASCLDKGSNFRTTSQTLMNSNSSRSHAIFTISIEQHQIDDLYQPSTDNQDQQVGDSNHQEKGATDEFMVAKFHFVDLAGSERAKKTGAVGATLKEGININKSLLVLGNVISALSDEGKKNNFIPYRDSKLTRILQDSLGGNSRTSMIACCSPAESNFDETLNTLNYASRARKIKNKPKVNRDPNSALIAELRQQCYEFQKECLRFRKILVSNQIEFKDELELPSEEELAAKEQTAGALGPQPMPMSNPGLSGKEIRALEDEIKLLKAQVAQKDKQNQSLNVTNQGLQDQLDKQQIENFSMQQQKDTIRLQIDQVNSILEKMGYKEQVYGELEKQLRAQDFDQDDQQQSTQMVDDENRPQIFGLGSTLLEEYQQQIRELRKEVDDKKLETSQLQNEIQTLLKQSEDDQKILEKQSQEIEKYKRNVAKLQKENVTLQNTQRQLQKQVKTGVAPPRTAGARDTRAMAVESLKQSFTMQRNSGQEDLDFMQKELEQNLKNFNDKFMETLTTSLTKQLGFDLTEAVEKQRKMTVGSSFIEKSSSGPLDLNFGQQKEAKSPIKGLNPFGPQSSLGGNKPMSMSSSVIVPGLGGHRMPNQSQIPDHAQNMKKKLSVIKDTETIQEQDTINETDTVQDENLRGSDEEGNQNKKRPVDDPNQLKQSHLSQDQASQLEEMLSKRASMLASERAKNSTLQHEEDAEMKDEQPVVVEEEEEFEEVAVQDCSDQESQSEEENDEMERRDVPDEELFNKIEQKEQEQKRDEHNSIIVQLDGSLFEKEKLLEAIKASQQQMQNDLLGLMKNQYHKKVLDLTNEITQLEKEKAESMKQSAGKGLSDAQKKKLQDQYLTKQRDLEKQLKDVKEKNKQQNAIKRQVDSQQNKIKGLESEISKIKTQKISAQRKWKEETERHNKLRKEKADEILRMKKANVKKDKEIDKLKKEVKRKDILNKRQREENKVIKIQKQGFDAKKANASKMRQQKLQIDVEKVKQWIRTSVDKMIEIVNFEHQMRTHQQSLEEVQEEIEQEVNHKASLHVLKEKLYSKKYSIERLPIDAQDQEEIFNVDQELEKLEFEIQQYQENVDSLTEKQDYFNTKMSEISKEIVQINIEFTGSLGKQNLSSPEGVKALVDSFFQVLREASQKLRQLEVDYEKQLGLNEQLKEDYNAQTRQLDANEMYFQAKMQNIENEYHQKEILLNQLIEEAKQEQEDHPKTQNMVQGGGQASNVPSSNPTNAKERMLTAKEQILLSKESAINESKMFLSKRVAELERMNASSQNLASNIQNKLNLALSEKEGMKSQISQLKNQLRIANEMSSAGNQMHGNAQQRLGAFQAQQPPQLQKSASTSSDIGLHSQTQKMRISSLADKRLEMKKLKNENNNKDQNMQHLTGKREILEGNATPRLEKGQSEALQPNVIPFDDDEDGSGDDSPPQQVSIAAKQNSAMKGKSPRRSGLSPRQGGAKAASHYQSSNTMKPMFTQGQKHRFNPTPQASQATKKPGQNVYNRLAKDKENTQKLGHKFGSRKQSEVDPKLNKGKLGNKLTGAPSQKSLAHASSTASLGTRKQSTVIKSGPSALNLNFNPGKINETQYSSRDHYTSQQEPLVKPDQLMAEYESNNVENVQSYDEMQSPQVAHYTSNNGSDGPKQFYEPESWNVSLVLENAHSYCINDLDTIGNLLYSTSSKNLKIWDLNTMQIISDIKAHQGAINCVKVKSNNQDGENIFVTAGDRFDKCMHIWDMTTLTNMATLRGHKGDIRAVEFSKDGKYLFSAGMGGMLVWDLRNTEAPVELIEKHMDIFALKTTQSHLFLGCRNHSIIPVGLSAGTMFADHVQQPMKQPHYDVVTSFTTLYNDKILVSASKDKNFRGWASIDYANTHEDQLSQMLGQSTIQQNSSNSNKFTQLQNMSTNGAHQDHINVIESSHDQTEMYSGSKDGIVHIWNLQEMTHFENDAEEQKNQVQNMSIRPVASLQAQGSAVTAIAALEPTYGKMIIYGSQDKSLRVCKGVSQDFQTGYQEFVQNFDYNEQQDANDTQKGASKHNLSLNLSAIQHDQNQD